MFVYEDEILVEQAPYELTQEDIAHLNEDSYWNGEDCDPDGRLAEAQHQEDMDTWCIEVGCVFGR